MKDFRSECFRFILSFMSKIVHSCFVMTPVFNQTMYTYEERTQKTKVGSICAKSSSSPAGKFLYLCQKKDAIISVFDFNFIHRKLDVFSHKKIRPRLCFHIKRSPKVGHDYE